MWKATNGWNDGITIGGRNIVNLRYADDSAVFGNPGAKLCQLFQNKQDKN